MEIIDKTHNNISAEESARCDALQAEVLAVFEKHGVTDYAVYAVIDGKIEGGIVEGIKIEGLSMGFDAMRPPFALDFAKKTVHLAKTAMTFQKIMAILSGSGNPFGNFPDVRTLLREMDGDE